VTDQTTHSDSHGIDISVESRGSLFSRLRSGGWLEFIGFLVVLLLLRSTVIGAYKIPSESMEDTLLVGDFIFANKAAYGGRLPLFNTRLPGMGDPEHGDIIVFYVPTDGTTRYIKRCVGLPGDTIEVKRKVLYVNGEVQPFESDVKHIDTADNGNQRIRPRSFNGDSSRDNWGPFVVPPDHYFMMGDNRDNSYDSRYWGPVPSDLIIGQALFIHWSWDGDATATPDAELSDPLSVPRVFVHNAIHFFEKVRWGRIFNGL